MAAVSVRDFAERPGDRQGLAQTLMTRFGALGGVELELPARDEAPQAADLPQ